MLGHFLAPSCQNHLTLINTGNAGSLVSSWSASSRSIKITDASNVTLCRVTPTKVLQLVLLPFLSAKFEVFLPKKLLPTNVAQKRHFCWRKFPQAGGSLRPFLGGIIEQKPLASISSSQTSTLPRISFAEAFLTSLLYHQTVLLQSQSTEVNSIPLKNTSTSSDA